MRAVVHKDFVSRAVKVYFVEDLPEARVAFLWPEEYGEFGWVWKREEEHRGLEPRPALEMNLAMWDAFTKSLLEAEHIRVDALDIVAKTLEREQARVDKFISLLMTPVMVSTRGNDG